MEEEGKERHSWQKRQVGTTIEVWESMMNSCTANIGILFFPQPKQYMLIISQFLLLRSLSMV